MKSRVNENKDVDTGKCESILVYMLTIYDVLTEVWEWFAKAPVSKSS